MKIILAKENLTDQDEMRSVYCSTLTQLAEANTNIVALDAGMMAVLGMKVFSEQFPDRMINCGVQEANMYGVAAGLSAVGKIPFAHTFTSFSTRRALDQIYVSAAYAKQNVKVVGSDPGITASLNGGTHMSFEDIGIMRGMPEMTVIEPTDNVMLKDTLRQVVGIYGMFYIRLQRKNVIKVYEEGSTFQIGKSALIKEGQDVTLIANGICVAEAIKAGEVLKGQGVFARILDMFTIKPIDREAIIQSAVLTGSIVTIENHNIINGLGSAVAEILVEECPVPMERVGVNDEFGEVGPVDYLKERYQLTSEQIVNKAFKVIERKNAAARMLG